MADVTVNTVALSRSLARVMNPSKKGFDTIPSNPYKSVICDMQCAEQQEYMLVKDKSPPPDVVDFTNKSLDLVKQLVALGDAGAYGLKHLARLVSQESVERVRAILDALNAALGSPKEEVNGKGLKCLFIEVASINACLSETLSQPLMHRCEVTVEAIVTNMPSQTPANAQSDNSSRSSNGNNGNRGASATFDDCITAFVRRIMEEAFQAEQSEDVLVASITAVMQGNGRRNVQQIDVRSMKTRRQQGT